MRLRIDAMEGGSHGGFAFLVSDGETEYNLLFRPDGVSLDVESGFFGTGAFVAADHSTFLTYTLTAAGGSDVAELHIDGAFAATQPPAALVALAGLRRRSR